MLRVAPWGTACALLAALLVVRCGGGAPPKTPEGATTSDAGAPDASDAGPNVCTGTDLDLTNVLVQSACEVENAAPDAKKPDVSSLLDVKVAASPSTVAPGGHADLIVTYTNKSQAPLSLSFLLDPTPRFTVEVYNAKNARAEMPKTQPPHVKGAEGPPPEASAPGTARVTLPPGGKASAKVDFNAVKLRWAPELVRGTPPEQGFPTAPAGPLPKGTYTVKVLTPLTGVFEGLDREVSTVKTTVVVQ